MSVRLRADACRSMDFEVLTLARGGLDTRETVRLAAPDDFDWIVYSFGTNDAAPWKQVPRHEYERNDATLLTAGAGAGQLVLGPPPVSDRQIGRVNNVLHQYSDIAGRVAEEHGAHFVEWSDTSLSRIWRKTAFISTTSPTARLPNWLATFFDLRNSWDRRSRGPGARGTATITGLARRLYLWGRAGLEGEPWAAPGEAGR